MPELPEAQTIVGDLRRHVMGRLLAGADVAHPDVLVGPLDPRGLDAAVRGNRIEAVERRGKNVVLRLSTGARLLINLGMTGRLVSSGAPAAAGLGHVAVAFRFQDGGALLFDDARRFGRVALLSPEAWRRRTAELGLEPLDEGFTVDALRALVRATRSPVRNLLLDQRRIAGIGNIYANEALYRACIRPRRRARTLTRRETALLRDAIVAVLRDAIRARGTTLRDYRDGNGEAGGFEPLLEVYGREGEPCPRCGTPIRRVVLTNRSAFYCPSCQS
jgi:formamidopyrimidine-DNA glycosylase